MPRKTDKRHRLVDAAKSLIHQQGFNLTTLADIAQEADVPLGNVYYYFKTKEAIGIAVIDRWSQHISELAKEWNQAEAPYERLIAYLKDSLQDIESIARFGCPIGGLCQELGKHGGPLADLAAKLLHDQITWLQAQFQSAGHAMEKAESFAKQMISLVQGMYLLTHTFKDPKIAMKQTKVLEQWLKNALTVRTAQPEDVFA